MNFLRKKENIWENIWGLYDKAVIKTEEQFYSLVIIALKEFEILLVNYSIINEERFIIKNKKSFQIVLIRQIAGNLSRRFLCQFWFEMPKETLRAFLLPSKDLFHLWVIYAKTVHVERNCLIPICLFLITLLGVILKNKSFSVIIIKC